MLLVITLGFLVMTFIYSSRLKKLDPLYRNGVLMPRSLLPNSSFCGLIQSSWLKRSNLGII